MPSRQPPQPSARALFVTGTDTDAGKSILSAALLAAVAASGRRVRAHKPALTGLEEPAGAWPPDHELLAQVTGMPADTVAPLRYGPAVSPHLAARLAGERVDFTALLHAARAALASAQALEATLVLEGVGGLLTPLTDEHTVRDLIRALALPVLLAARPGLGTINHTLLALEAARMAGVEVRAVVLTPWPDHPSALELSNRATIASLGGVEVASLPAIPACSPAQLARAAAGLPWRRWLGMSAGQAGSPASGAASGRRAGARPTRTAASTASLTVATS